MSAFGYFIVLLQQYIAPFLFAIGLIFFIYGIIKYFILGPSDESTRDEGRINFIKALVWFIAGLILYGVTVLIVALLTWSSNLEVERSDRTEVLVVPNTPDGNN